MEKQIYLHKKESIKQQIQYFREQEKDLINTYIDENKQFEIGDRVIVNEKEFGYVFGFEVNWQDEVVPKLYKEKKDGTPSKHTIYVNHQCTIEMANNQLKK